MGMPGRPFVVTIDGPAGAGKSTTARRLAARLGFTFLDTGAIYRAVALRARQQDIDWADAAALAAMADGLPIAFVPQGQVDRVMIGQQDVTRDIRAPEISEGASRVSAHPQVRTALLDLQRRLGATSALVAEGRDTGTVIFPDAAAKFFLTASAEERARRRARELESAGSPMDLETVLREMRTRDERDSTRAVAPLRRADDAVELVTDGMGPEEVVERMVEVVRSRGG